MATVNLRSRSYTIVRGSGEIASGIAHTLHKAGFPVVVHDIGTPSSTRRRMSFTDAVFDGTATLSGVTARRADTVAELLPMLARRRFLPVTVMGFTTLLAALPWAALVDARMRVRQMAEPQMRLAPLTVGIGPGFVADASVAVAVDTDWQHLGRIVARGPTTPATEPQKIAGIGHERFIQTPFSGTFRSRYDVGHWVTAGDIIAQVDEAPLAAPLTGVLRGITRDGVPVAAGTKVIEVDPRGWDAVFSGIGERPFKVSESVLAIFEAVAWETLVDAASQPLAG